MFRVVKYVGMREELQVIGSAGSGAEALTVIPREKPDLVLLDLRMPGIDGISVLQQLQKTPDCPKVIVLTSYAQDELIYQAIKAGAWGYLLKDTSEEEIMTAISSVLAGRHYIPVDISSRLAERMRRTGFDASRVADPGTPGGGPYQQGNRCCS